MAQHTFVRDFGPRMIILLEVNRMKVVGSSWHNTTFALTKCLMVKQISCWAVVSRQGFLKNKLWFFDFTRFGGANITYK
jgi:hypothetical protein